MLDDGPANRHLKLILENKGAQEKKKKEPTYNGAGQAAVMQFQEEQIPAALDLACMSIGMVPST